MAAATGKAKKRVRFEDDVISSEVPAFKARAVYEQVGDSFDSDAGKHQD
jgi:hypothetical protein